MRPDASHLRLGAICRNFEALEDAGLLSKEKLLSGDIMPGFASKEERDALLQTDE